MKKIRFIVLALIAAFLISAPAFAQQYDKALVVKTMRESGAAMGAINAAIGKMDYDAAAEKLMVLAQGMNRIKMFTPPKGEQAGFTATINELVFAAYRGIGAAGMKDADALKKAVGEIGAAQKKGHSSFR